MRLDRLFFLFCLLASNGWATTLELPHQSLSAKQLAVIVNEADPLSVQIADYYQQRRNIPEENIIRVRFKPGQGGMSLGDFRRLYVTVVDKTPEQVQAYALTWAWPYRVECMSITTAFATGFNRKYCAVKPKGVPCGDTALSPYFSSRSLAPYKDHKLRPTMAIAASSFEQAKALIDRGVASDGSYPKGSAYLLHTSDIKRTVRAQYFPLIKAVMGEKLPVHVLRQNTLLDKDDVLFYFTGLKRVEGLDSLGFVPGAVADHLTSAGGVMRKEEDPQQQMSILRWLEAGATGSYGTVVEPCNYLAKFPHPGVFMRFYLAGSSLIEAYWKSVAKPGEGLFIGEPLAAPFATRKISIEADRLELSAGQVAAGEYRLEVWDALLQRHIPTGKRVRVNANREVNINGLDRDNYRLVLVQ